MGVDSIFLCRRAFQTLKKNEKSRGKFSSTSLELSHIFLSVCVLTPHKKDCKLGLRRATKPYRRRRRNALQIYNTCLTSFSIPCALKKPIPLPSNTVGFTNTIGYECQCWTCVFWFSPPKAIFYLQCGPPPPWQKKKRKEIFPYSYQIPF